MFAYRYIKSLFLILFFLTSISAFAQLSKTHYIPPLTSAEFGNANPEEQYIYLSTPSNSDISYTIKPVGQPATSNITGIVSNANPQEVFIGNGNGQLFIPSGLTSTVVNNRGYIIEAEGTIYVSVRMNAGGGAQAGALVSKGISALGTTFRVGSYTNQNPQDNYLNFVSVMATEDNTQVTFSNLPTGLIIKNYSGTTPVNVTLDEGESYTIATNSFFSTANRDGLIGALISSDKNIVVNCGSANGSFHNGNSRDYGLDQIVGLDKVGTEYIFVKGDGENGWENVLIVPHTPGTTISINGGAPTTITGKYQLIEGNQYNTFGNLYVKTSEPVFAYQGIGSNSEANQGMFFVPPLSCETRGNVDNIANIDNIGSTVYNGGVSIVTKVGANVTINNLPLSNFSTVGPSTITGNPDYITYRINGLTNNVSVQGDDELYVAYYNVNGVATSGSFYSGFPSAPEINFDIQFATLGNCIPNVDLTVANAQNFDSFQWFFDDGSGSGFVDMNNINTTITPTNPGKYKLIGVIACTGKTLESVEIPVSICPDDIDNDGIIDNIDIDNDNDGILNCTESLGDVSINLTNTTLPQFIFQDGSTSSTLANGVYTQSSSSGNTNSFSGTNTGNFTSVVNSANNAENDYTLSFSESVNVKFSENVSVTHVATNGEFFIAKISPVNKNITLVDPDNRLLVDSNFDGAFETGITQISGSEIHFKINPSPTGTTPYQFLANQVDGFTFKHNLTNTNNPSTFRGNISLTCFKKDNDLDGVKDDLDLDSDNDGVPDSIENRGTLVTLSNIDTDANGLDDVYDITVLPIDTDTDGILDFYDLDSDNDGIYDLIETGQLGTLSDTNLNGIEDGPTYGTNGWADAAETTPDSGLIGYTLNDLDTDSIFSYIDLDSDGDDCSDVIEASFSDGNQDDLLGDNAVTVNSLGLVNNATDGYTIPHPDYLVAAPITITTQPINTVVCESSDTTISVISSTVDTYQWEVSTDGINWNTITNDAIYNGSSTSDLNITTTPLTYNTYQYRVFLNVAGNTCGLYSDEVSLTVDDTPVANTAPTMRLCDDDNNGTIPFNLTLQNSLINNAAGITITYHASQVDANTNNLPLASPFESGNTTIYARVENNSNTSCFATSSFNLEVYNAAFPLDTLNITPLQECDTTIIGTDTDGLIIFDLTQKETEILNGQSSTGFTLTYFTDAGYNNQIITPNAFTNTISGGQTIYVRMTNNLFTDCYTDTAFEIEVFELPVVNTPNLYSQCDDDSNDGQATFNLTLDSIKAEINTNYIAEGLTFTYFETQTEAQTNSNPIPNPDNYTDALGFTIETVWVRAENPNGCFREVPLMLEVSPSSAALGSYNPIPIYQCDDGADDRDGVSTFNLTDIHDHISTVIFSTFNVTVHFFESQLDAELETNEILDITNHQNINSPNIQDIWVRVKSDLGNNCLGLEGFANLLNVEALPTANPVSITRQCDFDTTDTAITYPFDTSQIEINLLNGQTLANVTVEYSYLDSDGTTTVSNTLPNPFLTATQTVTIQVTNNSTLDADGPCYDETTLEFIVDEQPIIASTIPPQIFCDDGTDATNENDGIHEFNTSLFSSTILGNQSNMDIFYNYIDEAGNSVIGASTLPNILISGNQTISVEIVNPINTSCTASSTIDLVVNPVPEFFIEEEEIVCTSNPTFSIDLEPVQLNPLENFNYEWVDQNGVILSNATILPVSTPGEYSITLTNPITNCSKTKVVSVKASELANITLDHVTVEDISENNTVTIVDPINLGSGNYQFSLESKDGDILFPFQDSTVFINVRAGTYTLYVKEDICGTVNIDVYVVGYRKFFTPNGDGRNDYWQVKGINPAVNATSDIYIFDRYGKLLKQLNPLSQGWDGTFNGQILPTDDYWFRVLLEDGRPFIGHFTLKR